MIYLGILYIFVFNSLVTKAKDNRILLFNSFLFLFIFLSFRFGQGTDYFNYKILYVSFPVVYDGFFLDSYLRGVEPFFYLLNIFAKKNNLGFQFVIVFSALISCFFLILTLNRYSRWKTLSILILFTNYFFYYQNALRQAIAMSIALYAILDYLYNKKTIKYYLLIFLAMMFHSASIICFFVPILLKLKMNFVFNYFVFTIFVIIGVSFSLFIPNLLSLVFSVFEMKYSYYLKNLDLEINILPLMIRLLFSYFAIYIYIKNNFNKNSFDHKILYIYLFGTIIYSCFSTIAILSRFTDFYTFLEIIVYPNLLFSQKRKSRTLFFITILIPFCFLFFKDIKEAIRQDSYYSNRIIDYPYITIFNKNRITDYKEIVQNNRTLLLK